MIAMHSFWLIQFCFARASAIDSLVFFLALMAYEKSVSHG